MSRKLLTFVVLLLAGLTGRSVEAEAAAPVDVPMADGSYVDWNDATELTNCTVENDGANVGSTGSGTVVKFDVRNTVEQDYILSFATGAKDEATLRLTLAGDGGTVLDTDVTVTDTESWDLTDEHRYLLSSLPAGSYTLTFAVTETTGSYAGNWGRLSFAAASGYDRVPGAITLAGGTYTGGMRVESAGNVGYIRNGAAASYGFICTQAGAYSLTMDMARYDGGTMLVTVADASTGATEASTSFAVDESVSASYAAQSIVLPGYISEGLKTLTLAFSSESDGYICNYQNVGFNHLASLMASVTGVTIAGQTVVGGDSTDWLCNLPTDYDGEEVTFGVESQNCTLSVTAADEAGNPVAVTALADGNYSVPVPQANTAVVVAMRVEPVEGAAALQEEYTLRLFRLGDMLMTAITVDGEELPAETLDALNADAHEAVFGGNVYTALPRVEARFIDGTVADGTGVLMGTSATYTVTVADGDATREYVLTVEGVHIYNMYPLAELI